ncbi:hypothetical protein ASPZODRAFT_15271 [Penicilliopsis zonata CBS 506.65]|uniref:Leucine Rich Repeat domain protein n=1 Tax=Penicilliopsis zonata CBS 506.65 TaxID=1073090 RepID=A0A1L9SKR4_9EURO|nr:hypothetical protein ASPZODRAFT_15271 [Penicilliopsis zonata CBS 506.65]OJJ47822.1 hypothetical protein ASPZODRAFT_15271 [Penicilliopsis zonata CBS 506.65]
MEKLNTEDGHLFIKNLASFVRTHEKALANALQLRRQPPKNAAAHPPSASSASSTLAAALSLGALKLTSQAIKPAKLTLTPHHLFYLLSRFEDLTISVGPMNVRLENIHAETLPSYVSFLNQPRRARGDRESIHSVSSIRSVMSGISSLWSSFGLGSKDAAAQSRSERARAALDADLKYLYSAFTKIPCLRLAPDHRARLIRGYEEFPFDTAVPLHAFKNLSALEIIDIDFRSFYGWDRLAEQLRTLTIKRASLDDPADLLTGIVLDDMDRRRRRSSSKPATPVLGWTSTTSVPPPPPAPPQPQPVGHRSPPRDRIPNSLSAPGSPTLDHQHHRHHQSMSYASSASPQASSMIRVHSEGSKTANDGSSSPSRPNSAKQQSGGGGGGGGSGSSHHQHHQHHHHHHHQHHRSSHGRGPSSRMRRTGSGSSNSSETSASVGRTASSSNLLAGILPASKWRFLRHLGLPDNALTALTAASLAPVANTLHSLDLSANLFAEVPDSLASLVALRALNLSHCMIDSLHSLSHNPLPAITALNLRANRLRSLAGIERLLSLERLDLRDNGLADPTEIARLTSLPEIREIWVAGNPFVKTHPNYRVTIFNLFRRTPGYSEDIIIDGSGPGYTERKQLIDRVAEPESAPVIRPVPTEEPAAVIIKSVTALAPSPPAPPPPHPPPKDGDHDGTVKGKPPATEVGTATRRKKPVRRKIVDLSLDSTTGSTDLGASRTAGAPIPPVQIINLPADPFTESSSRDRAWPLANHSLLLELPPTAVPPAPALPVPAPSSLLHLTSPTMLQSPLPADTDWPAVHSDLYRQKLAAALQHEVGSSWLTVLSDQTWDSAFKDIHVHPAAFSPCIQASPVSGANS